MAISSNGNISILYNLQINPQKIIKNLMKFLIIYILKSLESPIEDLT